MTRERPETTGTTPAAVPTKQEFRDVIGRFASGVTVITTRSGEHDFGSTVSAVSSLTDEPPMLLICLNRNSATGRAVDETGVFAVNILSEDHADLAARFATRVPDKFEGVPLDRDHRACPLIAGAIAHLLCTVEERVLAGTHYVFLARVDGATSRPGDPLAYFRGAFAKMQLAPSTAGLATVREWARAASIDADRPVSPAELAGELGLDRHDVDHCLRALADEGLVARSDGRYTLQPVPTHVLTESYTARLIIELGVAGRTVETATDTQLAELRRRMEATLPLVRGDRFTDVDAWIEANETFHEYLVSLAGSTVLSDAYCRLGLPGLNRRTLTSSSLADPVLLDDHREIVAAYERRDLAALTRVITAHAGRPQQIRAREAASTQHRS